MTVYDPCIHGWYWWYKLYHKGNMSPHICQLLLLFLVLKFSWLDFNAQFWLSGIHEQYWRFSLVSENISVNAYEECAHFSSFYTDLAVGCEALTGWNKALQCYPMGSDCMINKKKWWKRYSNHMAHEKNDKNVLEIWQTSKEVKEKFQELWG